MPSNLPIEIYQVIIDFIAGYTECYMSAQTIRDLCACCLVCTSFVPLCQRHIFVQAYIEKKRRKGHIALPSALPGRPDLSTYMKRLVYLNRQDATKITAPCMSALMNLPQLHRLVLWCQDESPIFGRDVSEPFGPGQFFKHYISSKTLTTLSFYRVRFLPIYDVLSAVNLTYLQILRCGVIVEPDRLPVSTNLRLLDIDAVDGLSFSNFLGIHTRLETLCLYWLVKGVTDSLTLSKVFPRLRKLRVCHDIFENLPEQTRIANRILETTGGLECLEVVASFKVFSLPPEEFPLQIQQCVLNSISSLKRLHLYLTVERAWFVHEGLYNVLSAVSGHNIIEEVEVVIFFSGFYLPFEHQEGVQPLSHNVTPTMETWSKLDELFDGKNMFPCLEKVSVLIVLGDWDCDALRRGYKLDCEEVCEFRQSLRRSFHRVRTNPKIRFSGDLEICHDSTYRFPDIYKF